MKIEVGIFSNQNQTTRDTSLGWQLLCEQEKIPHRSTDKPDCPVIVCEGQVPIWCDEYMDDGGILILTGCHPSTIPFNVEFIAEASLENIDLSELDSSITRVQCIACIFNGKGLGKIQVHEKRISKNGIIQDEFPVFLFHEKGKGGCWYTGLPLSKLVNTVGDSLRVVDGLDGFSERMVSVDKHNILAALRNILIRAFHRRKMPYVHLWYYPDNYQSVLSFRIDVDGVYGDNLKNISDAGVAHDIPITFFINKSLCKKDESRLHEIDPSHEIGNHADIHNLFSDYESNFQNIKNCMTWLDQIGIKNGKWFAAPRGMWNFSLHQALEDLGYIFTSDFGCAIAGFPFFPYIYGRSSRTMQIPVNPFSAERASIWLSEEFQRPLTAEFVIQSYLNIIHQNFEKNYPIMIYSHPEQLGRIAEIVLDSIKKEVHKRHLWITAVSQFANWWNLRDCMDFSAFYDREKNKVEISGNLDSKIKIKEIY